MPKLIRVFFPEFETEAHRQNWEGARLVAALADEGVECVLKPDRHCDAAFVASFSTFHDAAHGYRKDPFNRPVLGYKHFPEMPVVHYCWDLYPFKVKGDADRWRWDAYCDELRGAAAVWVPSACTVDRVKQYTGRGADVVLSSCPQWEPPDGEVWDGGYVVDVLRPYPGDPNNGIVKRTCEELGIPCYELGEHGRTWDEFRRLIAGARLLVSAATEASTGGLTLLEGLALGKHILISNSERHGGSDYFGGWAHYFDWNSQESFRESLRKLANEPLCAEQHYIDSRRNLVRGNYSDQAFARRIATGLREVLGG